MAVIGLTVIILVHNAKNNNNGSNVINENDRNINENDIAIESLLKFQKGEKQILIASKLKTEKETRNGDCKMFLEQILQETFSQNQIQNKRKKKEREFATKKMGDTRHDGENFSENWPNGLGATVGQWDYK